MVMLKKKLYQRDKLGITWLSGYNQSILLGACFFRFLTIDKRKVDEIELSRSTKEIVLIFFSRMRFAYREPLPQCVVHAGFWIRSSIYHTSILPVSITLMTKAYNQPMIAAIHFIKTLLFIKICLSNLAMTGSNNILEVTYKMFTIKGHYRLSRPVGKTHQSYKFSHTI